MSRIKALSMFSGGGIAETYFEESGIDVVVANELIEERANFYKANHPKTKMICGDITNKAVFDEVIDSAKKDGVKFLFGNAALSGYEHFGFETICHR